MEGGYKGRLYQKYNTNHIGVLYGSISLETMVTSFKLKEYFYGSHLPIDLSKSILEIGCGNGNFIYYLQNKGYKNIKGIDLSHEQIESGKNIGVTNIEVADLNTYIDNQREEWDCIVALDVIEHLTRQEAFDAFCKCNLALKQGGRFIMQVPNGEGLYYTSIFYGDYTHEVPYTLKSARHVLLNAGFTKIHAYPVNPYPGSLKGKIRSILWKLKVLQTRFWKMVETGSASGIFTSNIIVVAEK